MFIFALNLIKKSTPMKRLFLLLLAGVVLSIPCVFAEDDEEIPQAPPSSDNESPHPSEGLPTNLPIEPIPNPEQLKPRSLSPISGIYVDGVVELYFAADVGSVSVTVSSSTTGNMWSEESESCDGLILVNIGRAPGSYVVNIDTETAGSFVGQFTI